VAPFAILRTRHALTAGVCLAVTAAMVGCSGDAGKPPLARVSGTVSYKGKPVESGRVVFTPVVGKGGDTGQSASGMIGPDGSYSLTTFEENDGAILGEHVVTVDVTEKDFKSPEPKADGTIDYTMPKQLGPKKYTQVESSPLRTTVKEGSNTFNIEMTD